MKTEVDTIREALDRQVLAVWADCAGIADTLYEDESIAGNGTVINAIHAANNLSRVAEDMKDNLDRLIAAVQQQTYEAIRPEEATEGDGWDNFFGHSEKCCPGDDYAAVYNKALSDMDKCYKEVTKKL